jgi:hypothetical protein
MESPDNGLSMIVFLSRAQLKEANRHGSAATDDRSDRGEPGSVLQFQHREFAATIVTHPLLAKLDLAEIRRGESCPRKLSL